MSSTHNGATVVFDNFAFPLAIDATFLVEISVCLTSLLSIHHLFIYFFASAQGVFDQSYNRDLLPLPIVVRSNIQDRQLASEFLLLFSYWANPKVFLRRRHLRCGVKWNLWKQGEWNQQ